MQEAERGFHNFTYLQGAWRGETVWTAHNSRNRCSIKNFYCETTHNEVVIYTASLAEVFTLWLSMVAQLSTTSHSPPQRVEFAQLSLIVWILVRSCVVYEREITAALVSQIVDALPSRLVWGWCSQTAVVVQGPTTSQMYCNVPHSCCMWCHDDVRHPSSFLLYYIHTLQHILQESGLMWQRVSDPWWGLTGNIDVTVAVHWTESQIVASPRLTPQPAGPQDASALSLWSHLSRFLQQTRLNRNPTASPSSASCFLACIVLACFTASFVFLSLIWWKNRAAAYRALGRE